MEGLHLGEIWAAGAVIIGFQLVCFAWRLSRELELMKMHPQGLNWFPPADYLNLFSMLILVFTVFVYRPSEQSAALGLRLSLILLAAYPLATLGHYRLFRVAQPQKRPYCTLPEAAFIVVTIFFAGWFMISHNLFDNARMNWWIPGFLIVGVIVLAVRSYRSEGKESRFKREAKTSESES
jgi:amino acid transporter